MKKDADISRDETLEKIISDAQNMPGIIELLKVYGSLNELILKSNEYLRIYQPRTTSLSSNSSSSFLRR